jgi:hypothetical protein
MSFEFAAQFWHFANDNAGAPRERTVHIAGRDHAAQRWVDAIRMSLWLDRQGAHDETDMG